MLSTTVNNHLHDDIQHLVHGYIKHFFKEYIPFCLISLLIAFISIADEFTLFNYGYLNIDISASVLSGITFDFDIFHKIRINIGSKLNIDVYPKSAQYQVNYQNYSDGKQAIKTALGNIWKYSNEKITMLTLMSKQTICKCYNREGNQFTIYLLNNHAQANIIFNHSKIWMNYPLPLKFETDHTARILIDLSEDFKFDNNEDVTIEYLHGKNEHIINVSNENSDKPIGHCSQGWICCYKSFFKTLKY